jgi:hypothetical protein
MDPHTFLQNDLGGGWSSTSNKILDLTNSLEASVLFGELCNQYSYYKKHEQLLDDMFFCTHAQLESKLKKSAHVWRKAIRVLEKYNLISMVPRKDPARGSTLNYFKIHMDTLRSLGEKVTEPRQKSKRPRMNKVHEAHVKSTGPLVEKVHEASLKKCTQIITESTIPHSTISESTISDTTIPHKKIAEKYSEFTGNNITAENFQDFILANKFITGNKLSEYSNRHQAIYVIPNNLSADEKQLLFEPLRNEVQDYLKKYEI